VSVTYLIEFDVVPAQRDRFLQLLNGVLDAMRSEAMFLNATLHVSPDDENRFLLHETWRSHQDVLDVQIKRPYREAWHEALPQLLRKPRAISSWTPLRLDRSAEGG
jgi:quinol monooxygenase YgiN